MVFDFAADALQGTRDEHSSSVPGITAFLLYGALVSLLLVGQDFAALRTAASQNLTAVGSGHSLTEAMDLLTLTLLGLIGTEHSDTSSLKWTGNLSSRSTRHGVFRRSRSGHNMPSQNGASDIIHKRVPSVNKNFTFLLHFCCFVYILGAI